MSGYYEVEVTTEVVLRAGSEVYRTVTSRTVTLDPAPADAAVTIRETVQRVADGAIRAHAVEAEPVTWVGPLL